jgi:hypothetical protein
VKPGPPLSARWFLPRIDWMSGSAAPNIAQLAGLFRSRRSNISMFIDFPILVDSEKLRDIHAPAFAHRQPLTSP